MTSFKDSVSSKFAVERYERLVGSTEKEVKYNAWVAMNGVDRHGLADDIAASETVCADWQVDTVANKFSNWRFDETNENFVDQMETNDSAFEMVRNQIWECYDFMELDIRNSKDLSPLRITILNCTTWSNKKRTDNGVRWNWLPRKTLLPRL